MDNPGPDVIPLEDHGHKTDHHLDIQVPHVDSPKTVRKSLTKFLKKHYRTKSTATKQKRNFPFLYFNLHSFRDC